MHPAGTAGFTRSNSTATARLLAINGGQVRTFTRNGYDWSDRYGPIVDAAAKLRCQSAIIDGEVISPGAEVRHKAATIRTGEGIRLAGKDAEREYSSKHT